MYLGFRLICKDLAVGMAALQTCDSDGLGLTRNPDPCVNPRHNKPLASTAEVLSQPIGQTQVDLLTDASSYRCLTLSQIHLLLGIQQRILHQYLHSFSSQILQAALRSTQGQRNMGDEVKIKGFQNLRRGCYPMLTLVMAETALETLPPEIWRRRDISRQLAEKKLKPEDILLDRSYHHKAMLHLKDAERRGRPDIAHFSTLEATASPLYLKGLLKFYLHTYTNKVIELADNVRLPKTYARFEGLIIKLFAEKKVPETGTTLMQLTEENLSELITRLKPSKVIGLSKLGEKNNFRDVASLLSLEEKPLLVVGGFPKGPFSSQVREALDEVYSVCDMSLEAHVVVARILYEYERCISLPC